MSDISQHSRNCLCVKHEAERRALEASKALDADWLRKCEFSRDMRIVNFARAVIALQETEK